MLLPPGDYLWRPSASFSPSSLRSNNAYRPISHFRSPTPNSVGRDCAIRAALSRSRELIINVHMLRQLDVPDLPL